MINKAELYTWNSGNGSTKNRSKYRQINIIALSKRDIKKKLVT